MLFVAEVLRINIINDAVDDVLPDIMQSQTKARYFKESEARKR